MLALKFYDMAKATNILRFLICIFQLGVLTPVRGSLNSSQSYANVTEAIPQLQDFYTYPLPKSPFIGGRNNTRCCMQAVIESYQVDQNGHVVESQNGYIGITADALSNAQFPCGASYSGNDSGAPLVTVPYSWCSTNCAGWQESSNKILTQWVQPFVGFILPAAVFCLNVPRVLVFAIPDDMFPSRFGTLEEKFKRLNFLHPTRGKSQSIIKYFSGIIDFLLFSLLVFVEAALRGSLAALIALCDTIIWVGIVFSTAFPMVLSGLYEARLDRKIINMIESKKIVDDDPGKPRLYRKIHLLYAILVGNLSHSDIPGSDGQPESEVRSAWSDVKLLVEPLKVSPQQSNNPISTHPTHSEFKRITQTRLKSMLDCQASFGAAIGAPIVFFLGSFLFSVFSNLSTVGDNDTSHALAFGMWWMTIPHVAVVSGCLLAGNNPNTLEVIICGLATSWNPEGAGGDQKRNHWWSSLNVYGPFYKSDYQPVWMWERGRSKRNWIRRVMNEAPLGEQFVNEAKSPQEPRDPRYFKFDIIDWASLVAAGLALMATPFVLAFLTSFFTPTVGLSCRSFTFLLYFSFQVWLSILWFWDFRQETRHSFFTKAAWPPGSSEKSITVPSIYGVLMAIGLAGSTFTAIAGTFMQILGVYRNCLCTVPIASWSSRDNYQIVISTNTADDIRLANTFWLPTGVTSIVVLILVCYIGWWYQRHWRMRFAKLIDHLLRDPLVNGAGMVEAPLVEKKTPEVNMDEIAPV